MSIVLKKAGLLTTVQDLGRVGYRRFGVNPNGVMDRAAARIVNTLLRNDENEGVLEMHFPAAEIVFERPCEFAIGGADLSPELDGVPIANWQVHRAAADSTLRFAAKQLGNRAYFSVNGGFEISKWLGSMSTNLAAAIGGFDGRAFMNGDRIGFRSTEPLLGDVMLRTAAPSLIPRYSRFPTVRVIPGAEFDLLDDDSRKLFTASDFAITNASNRMGFRLKGEPLSLSVPLEPVSAAVAFGTVQLLPDGQMIALMADHQTSGGYPRIAHVVERDLPILGQLAGGNSVGFHIVTLSDAERLAVEFEHDIKKLRVGAELAKSTRRNL